MNSLSSNRIHKPEAGVRQLSTVLKTLEIIDLFSKRSRPMRLVEVSREMGLSRATAYQRLFTLISAGWLEQDEMGRYRLSMYPVRLAAAALDQADIGTRAEPVLTQLAEITKETASLAILDRGVPTIVARVETDSILRAEQKLGTPLSLEGSASGRVLAAFADEWTLERLVNSENELPSPEICAEVRMRGYAVSSGHVQVGVRAVAAPAFNFRDQCCATVSLVAPESRFDPDKLIEPLRKAAKDLSVLFKSAEAGRA